MLLWRVKKKIFNLTKGGFIFKMKLVKYLVTTAAITAVMAVSASAATLETSGDFTVSVDEATNKVSLSGIKFTDADGKDITPDQMTMLILDRDATNDLTENDIKQIDQVATNKTVAAGETVATQTMSGIAMNAIEVGKEYFVRIGGDGSIKTAKFKLVEDTPTTPKWHIGNVDLSGNAYEEDLEVATFEITVDDAILVLFGVEGAAEKFTDEQLEYLQILGDVNSDITDYESELPDVNDAIAILKFVAGEPTIDNADMVTYYYGE